MSPVSASTLFHFTPKRESLLNILTNEFQPHYSLEDLSGVSPAPDRTRAIAFPLVSFCDIPLSQTIDHMSVYGEYAIGLTKEWAIKNGVTPVLYYHLKSPNLAALKKQVEAGRAAVAADVTQGHPIARFACFIKPYEGELIRIGTPPRKVCFYNEREWRYVPAESTKTRVLQREEWEDSEKRTAANDVARALTKLRFEPDDIRYVIVPREADRLEMVRALTQIKSKHSVDSVAVLTSRLLSAEQIRADL